VAREVPEGLGRRRGKDYFGWIQVRDFGRLGRVSHIPSPEVDREIHGMFIGEEALYYGSGLATRGGRDSEAIPAVPESCLDSGRGAGHRASQRFPGKLRCQGAWGRSK
jgi:hypothetical protein